MESKKILKIDPGKPAAFGVVYYSTGPGGAGDYILSIVRAGGRVTVRVRVRVRVRFRVRTRMPVDRGIIDYTTVRENVCNNSKKRKKSCFFGF